MYQYMQFALILFGLSLYKAAVIVETNNESGRNVHCEIFQNMNFDGESLPIPESLKITNFTQLTQSWSSSESNGFHSFKLPSINSHGTICVINACTLENFQGNCTVFKLSRKRIQSCRLKSFECNCFNDHNDKLIEKSEVKVPVISDQSTVKPNCEGRNTIFENFTKLGKKIIGVGRNYVWHKTDLTKVVAGGTSPENPIIFLKPTTSYLLEGSPIHLPNSLGVIYYEIELAVIIGKEVKNVSETNALDYVAGYALALDLTAKEVLKTSILKGLPWELAKGFDGACPIGQFIPKECISNPNDVQLSAAINGVTTQNDSTSQMIFKIPKLISYISQYMTLEPNDVILTGTPDGFGQIKSGDVIEGSLNSNLAKIKFVVA